MALVSHKQPAPVLVGRNLEITKFLHYIEERIAIKVVAVDYFIVGNIFIIIIEEVVGAVFAVVKAIMLTHCFKIVLNSIMNENPCF